MYYPVIFFMFFLKLTDILGLDENCSRNSDCPMVNAICIDSKCSCDSISYSNGSHCLQYGIEYGAICYEDDQCEWLGDNYTCSKNRCVCSENFRWYKGKCQNYVEKGGDCSSDDECYNGYSMLSLHCSLNGKCECSSDFYDRGSDCRYKSKYTGDCALDKDCGTSILFQLECALGKCSRKSSKASMVMPHKSIVEDDGVEDEVNVKSLKYEENELSCEKDIDCRDVANSLCNISNKKCECNPETHYFYNGNCVRGISPCTVDTDCKSINTMCFKNSTCICKRGFFLKSGACVAELGMSDPSYDKNTICSIKPGQLIDSTCYCKNYWFSDEFNRNCIKTSIQTTNSCLTNEWCRVMGPYSFCNSTTNTCQCSSIAEFNNETYFCDKVSDDRTDICLKDVECNINEQCIDEKCECIQNFERNDDQICLPKTGGSCQVSSCSHIANANCLGGVCMCDQNYIGKEAKCLKMASDLDDPCEDQVQCQNIDHTICGLDDFEYDSEFGNETLKCVCEEGYTDVKNVCYQNKKYGDPCMTESECTLVLNRTYKCRNSICQCDVGKSLKNGYCTSAAKVILSGYLLWLMLAIKFFVLNKEY